MLATDAKIRLENHGYTVQRESVPKSRRVDAALRAGRNSGDLRHRIEVDGGTVNTDEVNRLIGVFTP